MAKVHVYRPHEVSLQKRFWQAFNELNVPLVRFTHECKINRQKYSAMRSELEAGKETTRHLDGSALVWICKRYKVSPTWLLLGKGEMFGQDDTSTQD